MRTTLEIDDDLLDAAKEISRRQGVSQGQVISRLLRAALTGKNDIVATDEAKAGGFRPFPARGKVISNDLIDNLRDNEGV
jgi:hypothetical protein